MRMMNRTLKGLLVLGGFTVTSMTIMSFFIIPKDSTYMLEHVDPTTRREYLERSHQMDEFMKNEKLKEKRGVTGAERQR